MNNSATSSPTARASKSGYSSGQPNGGPGAGAGAGGKEPQSAYGPGIAQTALQSIGMSTKNFYGPFTSPPEYALAVSIIFTKATNQAIMLGTEPRHVLSTSILWNSLLHDSRFKRVAMSEAAPGDIIITSGWHQAAGYAGIVVDHGRIVSNSRQGVRNNCSLLEVQCSHPARVLFRYIGVQGHRSYPLANQGYNPNEPRLPAGQPGGGQWTSMGAGTSARRGAYDARRESQQCAGEQITPEGVETEPGLREENELEDRVENFRELTPQEEARRENESKMEELAKQVIEDLKAETNGQKPAQKPRSLLDVIRRTFGGEAQKKKTEVASDLSAKEPIRESKEESKSNSDNKSPQDRGRDSEGRVLKDTGKEKNTKTYYTSQGDTIPDFTTAKEIGDVKDTKKLSNTRQMRAQREVAQDQGTDHVVYTGNNTRLSRPMQQSETKIVCRPDLGPQQSK